MRKARALMFIAASIPGVAGAGTLTTPGYIVKVTSACVARDEACGDWNYEGSSRKSGKSIKLRGTDVFHMCPGDQGDGPGRTPCHHLGYEFLNGSVRYFVGDDGTLEVKSGEKVLVNQQGEWEW